MYPNFKLNRQPVDPYDAPAWKAFYAANPGFRRSVGAEGVNDDDAAAKAAADKAAADKAAADKAAADKAAADKASDKNGPSDKEAELLKDVMKHKGKAKETAEELANLKKKYEGVDLEEYASIKNKQAEADKAAAAAEEQRLLDSGEFDKVKAQMIEQHKAALAALNEVAAGDKSALEKANSTINDLTVGAKFSESKFIADDTVYTNSVARKLYGEYFDIEDGKVVGYDKPRGHSERAPIVDASGENVSFDDAMMRIVNADPDKDDILISKLKPGAASNPGRGGPPEEKKTDATTSREKISSGLSNLVKNIDKPTESGITF